MCIGFSSLPLLLKVLRAPPGGGEVVLPPEGVDAAPMAIHPAAGFHFFPPAEAEVFRGGGVEGLAVGDGVAGVGEFGRFSDDLISRSPQGWRVNGWIY